MAQVTSIDIGSNSYSAYSDLDGANAYLAADFTAVDWQAETDPDKQKRALVTAARALDRVEWPGEKTEADQLTAFPRTGISGQDEDEVPDAIVAANIELARYIYDGFDVTKSSGLNNIKRQKAGSVEIEYVSPTLLDDPTRFPLPVQELIASLLSGGSGSALGAISSGTDGCSVTNQTFQPGINF